MNQKLRAVTSFNVSNIGVLLHFRHIKEPQKPSHPAHKAEWLDRVKSPLAVNCLISLRLAVQCWNQQHWAVLDFWVERVDRQGKRI